MLRSLCLHWLGSVAVFGFLTLIYCISLAGTPPAHGLQLEWEIGPTGSSASLRGISAPTASTIWLSGSNSTVLRSIDGGNRWDDCSPMMGELEFRSIVAHSESSACIASAGTPAIILKTVDGGLSWREVYRHQSQAAFFDSLKFWNAKQGIALSDPVDGKFLIVQTEDGGETWRPVEPAVLPAALPGEAAFAASDSSLMIGPNGQVWIGTGGCPSQSSRIYYRDSWHAQWQLKAAQLPSNATSGIFSLAQAPRDVASAGTPKIVAVGGDYRPQAASPTVSLFSDNLGTNWLPASSPPAAFRSAVVAMRHPKLTGILWITVGPTGSDYSLDGQVWREFSTHGFHALEMSQQQIFATGANGKFAKLKISP